MFEKIAAMESRAGLTTFGAVSSGSAQRAACALLQSRGAGVAAALADFTDSTWTDLLAAVSPEVFPFLDFKLETAGISTDLPARVQHALATARRAATVRELARRNVVKTAVSCLEHHGFETVLLKGAALAHLVYPQPAVRPMVDVDIWVKGRLSDAAACLIANGFDVPAGSLPDGELSPTLSQRRLHSKEPNIRVELHGDVHSFECLSKDRVDLCWTRSRPLIGVGTATRALGPEDALLHVCLHLGRTNRFAHSQLPLLDACLIVDTFEQQLDWTAMMRDWVEHGVSAYLVVALRLARTLWGARVPASIVDITGEGCLEEMEALALEQVWQRSPELPPALERIFRERPGGARVRALMRRLSSPLRESDDDARAGWHVIGRGAVRLRHDATTKIWRYVRAWARGDLGRRELQRRAGLAAARGRIGTLADHAETRLRDTLSRFESRS